MLHKILSNSFANKVCGCRVAARHSALFINGLKATDTFVFVTPHIDYPEQIKQKNIIQNQLVRRKINIDLEKIENLWNIYDLMKQRKSELETKKTEITTELAKLIKINPESEVVNQKKIHLNLIKDNIKKLNVPLWSAEEYAILEVLKLPNTLHTQTPNDENKILYTHLKPPHNFKDHLKIGRELGILIFKKNENYYLKGDAALLELGAKFYFSDILKKENYIQFSNPDFVKSVIIEGCGGDHTNPRSSFILHHNEPSKMNIDNRLHLVGGGSLCSFFAYHAKSIVYAKALPLKYFSLGRQYVPSPAEQESLFHVSQSSVVQFFGVARDANDLDELLNETITILKNSYMQLGYHFRMSIVSADKLNMWESLRVIIEMYSTSLISYIEVANISISGDFISKRLMFTFNDKNRSKFPHIISGTVLNVPKFLACILEQDDDFSVPEKFQVYNWKLTN